MISANSAVIQADMLPQHAEPLPQPEPASNPGGFGFSKGAIGTIALLVGGPMAVGLLPLQELGTSPQPMPVPQAIEQPVTQPNSGPSLIQPALAADLHRAIDGMQLSDADKARLRTEMDSGKTRLGWVTVSDSVAETGTGWQSRQVASRRMFACSTGRRRSPSPTLRVCPRR